MGAGKTFRQGQILRLVTGQRIANQEDLRRRLAAQKMRVTQATLSRDLQELHLVKTQEGYKQASVLPEEPTPLPSLARALAEFLLDFRPAENLLVLKTPPSGLELARILLRHPALQTPVFYVRDANGTKCLSERFPQFRGWGEAPLRLLSVEAITSSGAGIAFLATPHEASAELAPPLLQAGLRVVDLSGAFRFRGAETFTSWYKLPAPHAEWLSEAAYGIPELYCEEIAAARLVANPGCYATSVILALRPLTDAGWIAPNTSVVCDCKSGASGAGKDPRRDLHFVEVD